MLFPPSAPCHSLSRQRNPSCPPRRFSPLPGLCRGLLNAFHFHCISSVCCSCVAVIRFQRCLPQQKWRLPKRNEGESKGVCKTFLVLNQKLLRPRRLLRAHHHAIKPQSDVTLVLHPMPPGKSIKTRLMLTLVYGWAEKRRGLPPTPVEAAHPPARSEGKRHLRPTDTWADSTPPAGADPPSQRVTSAPQKLFPPSTAPRGKGKVCLVGWAGRATSGRWGRLPLCSDAYTPGNGNARLPSR